MAQNPERESYNLFTALEKVGDADRNRDEVRADEARRLADGIISQHAGRATLREMVFAVHGFDLSDQPRDDVEERIQGAYNTLKAKFYTGAQKGWPVARIGDPSEKNGLREGKYSTLWIGRVVEPECYVSRGADLHRNPRYEGNIMLRVSDVRIPRWNSEAGSPDRQPTYSDAAVTIGTAPADLEAPIALAYSSEQLPGSMSVLDDGTSGYAIGWSEIVSRSASIDSGDVAAQLLLRRVADVMADFDQLRNNE